MRNEADWVVQKKKTFLAFIIIYIRMTVVRLNGCKLPKKKVFFLKLFFLPVDPLNLNIFFADVSTLFFHGSILPHTAHLNRKQYMNALKYVKSVYPILSRCLLFFLFFELLTFFHKIFLNNLSAFFLQCNKKCLRSNWVCYLESLNHSMTDLMIFLEIPELFFLGQHSMNFSWVIQFQ